MRILIWHVHGSWLTSFVQGVDEYLVPVVPDRGPDGRGRARTFGWPAAVREVAPEEIAEAGVDVVVLQRPHELDLLREWTGWRAGIDVPAVYVEHNTPGGPAATSEHPLAGRTDIRLVHVTAFNALMWDNGRAPTTVIEHGVPDPGHRYLGRPPRLAAVVNEPVRRRRVAGTDILLRIAAELPVEVFGMGMADLDGTPDGPVERHEDVPQQLLHLALGSARVYLHPYRWTSLGLSLIEAMMLGLPVLAIDATATHDAVPADAGMVSADPQVLIDTGRRWLADPAEAAAYGAAARRHALRRFGIDRFVTSWQTLLKEVTG
jgi:glycosyltransferase involved in cell wall biosynthesis